MGIIDKIDIEKITENIKNFCKKVFGSEAVRIGSAVFFGLILLIFLVPFLFNNSALKFQIEQKISQVYGVNFVIKGDVSVAFLPTPTITIHDALLQNYKPKAGELLDAEKQYNFYAKLVKIKLPLFKLSDDAFARKIIFDDVMFESYYEINQKIERKNQLTDVITGFANSPVAIASKLDSGLSAELFSIDGANASSFKSINLPDIVIKNGTTIFYDKLSRKQEMSAINVSAVIHKNQIAATGSFMSKETLSNFKILAKFNSSLGDNNSVLELISPALELRVKGSFTSENRGLLNSDFNGKIEAEISDIKTFYKIYVSDVSVIASKLKENHKSVKISADIEGKASEIAIKNASLNSSLLNGKGDIYLNLADKIPLIDINFNLEDLDLDNIWSGEAVAISEFVNIDDKVQSSEDNIGEISIVAAPSEIKLTNENKEKTLDKTIIIQDDKVKTDNLPPIEQPQPILDIAKELISPISSDVNKAETAKIEPVTKIEPINFDLASRIKNFDLTAEIKIKNVKYLDGEIKDVDFYATVSRAGQIMVLPMIFRIPGQGVLRVNGVFDNSAAVPKFVGKFDANGKVLRDVFQWLKIESQNLKFDNLKEYSLYSDVLLLPNSVTLNNFYLNLNSSQSELLGDIKIENGDKITNITNRFQVSNFNVDDYFLTSGQNVYFAPGMLLKKLLWLNDISSNNDLTLNFDKLIYKKEVFLDQSVKLRFGRGYFEVHDLKLKSDTTNLKADLAIDLNNKSPQFNFQIAADNFSYVTPAQNKSDGIEGPKSLVTDFFTKDRKQNFCDQFFALPSLEGLEGKISLKFNKLKLDDLEIKNVNLLGKLKDGSITVSQLSSEIYDGTLDYVGLIAIKSNKIVNGNLTMKQVSLQPILSDLFGIKNVSGVANITANITAAADSKADFAKTLTSEVKFNINAPAVDKYGLNDLVQKMFLIQNYRDDLRDPEKVLFNSDSKTIFKQATGTAKVNSGKEGTVRIDVASTALNGILSGKFDVASNSVDVLFDIIFLTGNRQKQVPLNIVSGLKGDMGNISQSTNLDQVKQYLGLIKSKPVPASSAQGDMLPNSGNQNSQLLPSQNQPPIGLAVQPQVIQPSTP